MTMNPKSNDLEVAPEHLSEQQIRKVAKAALKKADRFWRLAEKAPTRRAAPVPRSGDDSKAQIACALPGPGLRTGENSENSKANSRNQ